MRNKRTYPFEGTYNWLGFHEDPDQRGWYEGSGRAETLGRLRGYFPWVEDMTSDFDWRAWGEFPDGNFYERWQLGAGEPTHKPKP